jgi:hypothetical protein
MQQVVLAELNKDKKLKLDAKYKRVWIDVGTLDNTWASAYQVYRRRKKDEESRELLCKKREKRKRKRRLLFS